MMEIMSKKMKIIMSFIIIFVNVMIWEINNDDVIYCFVIIIIDVIIVIKQLIQLNSQLIVYLFVSNWTI